MEGIVQTATPTCWGGESPPGKKVRMGRINSFEVGPRLHTKCAAPTKIDFVYPFFLAGSPSPVHGDPKVVRSCESCG